ncbi:Alpha-1,4-glucan-protein synthase [Hordeum vulgare]|nr:Alpha-1,4-glucan-protein synthase [Hordeum vulgare]
MEMKGMTSSAVAAHKRGSRRWLKYGLPPPLAFERCELEEYEHELAARCIGSSAVGSSFAGASSSRTITPVKRRAEELGPLAVKLEDDAGELRGGVIGPEDYLPPGHEDHLMRAIMERSVREAAEDAASSISSRSSSSKRSRRRRRARPRTCAS